MLKTIIICQCGKKAAPNSEFCRNHTHACGRCGVRCRAEFCRLHNGTAEAHRKAAQEARPKVEKCGACARAYSVITADGKFCGNHKSKCQWPGCDQRGRFTTEYCYTHSERARNSRVAYNHKYYNKWRHPYTTGSETQTPATAQADPAPQNAAPVECL